MKDTEITVMPKLSRLEIETLTWVDGHCASEPEGEAVLFLEEGKGQLRLSLTAEEVLAVNEFAERLILKRLGK